MQTVHLFGRMNTDDADKDIPNNEIRYAKNLLPAKRSNGLRRELVRGNENISDITSLLDNYDEDWTNAEVIGSFQSTEKNELFIFYKNPNVIVRLNTSENGAYEFSFFPKVSSDLPVDNFLLEFNFDNVEYIYNISLINNLLHWSQSDGKQFCINTDEDFEYYPSAFGTSGFTTILEPLYLQKPVPRFPAVTEGVNTGSDTSSKSREFLEDKSLMFTYRFIYDDDDVSTFAPWSEAHPAFRIKKTAINSNLPIDEYNEAIAEYNLNPRYYTVTIQKNDIPTTVKSVEFASIDEEENISIFKRVDREPDWQTNNFVNGEKPLTVEFTGNELEEIVSLSEALKIQQPNPLNPTTSVGFNDRIFQCGGEVGLPYSGNAGITFGFNLINPGVTISSIFFNNPSATYSENGMSKLWARKPLFKAGGEYEIAVQFFDENFKRSFVNASNKIKVPIPANYRGVERYELTLQSFGDVPEWAKYYQFLRSDITNFVTYTTTKGVLLNYVSENSPNATLDDNQFVWQDRVYRGEANPSKENFSYTHILLPANLPFEIDNTYKLRFLNDDLEGEEYPIIEIIGNIAVIEKTSKSDITLEYNIEVFKENFEDIQILNEVGDVYPIADWGTSHKIPGDCYLVYSRFVNGANLVFDNFNPTQNQGTSVFTSILKAEIAGAESSFISTSQTTTIRQNTGSVTRLETEAEKTGEEFKLKNVTAGEWALLSLGIIGALINIKNKAGVEPVFKNKIVQKYANMVVNYDLAISSKGRPNVEYKGERVVTLDSKIFYSDPFVQGSKVNGLSNFQSSNTYDLPSERGPVVTLVPIESSTVMLALHPRQTTSLYIGEGFVRQGNDAILAKTEGVIGEDRPLRGGYGTTNPESVTVYKGTAIWWDQNKKDIIRYDNNGLTPLGLAYKVRAYLEDWGNALENSDLNVISGYDPYYECFFMKFPSIGSKNSETIYFSSVQGREGFLGVVEHQAESFTILQNNLISLNGKDIFKVSDSSSFYGGSRPTVSLDFVHNEQPMAAKIYENIAQNADVPLYTEIQTNRGQFTNMIEDDYRLYEDTYYTEVLRDTNTPDDLLEVGQIKLRDGNIMKGQFANVKLSSDEATELNEVVIGTQLSGGQYLMD